MKRVNDTVWQQELDTIFNALDKSELSGYPRNEAFSAKDDLVIGLAVARLEKAGESALANYLYERFKIIKGGE